MYMSTRRWAWRSPCAFGFATGAALRMSKRTPTGGWGIRIAPGRRQYEYNRGVACGFLRHARFTLTVNISN